MGIVCAMLFREPFLSVMAQGITGTPLGVISAPIKYSYIGFSLIFAVAIQLVSVIHVIIQIGNFPIKNLIFEELSTIQKVSKVSSLLGIVFLILSYLLYIFNDKMSFIYYAGGLILAMIGGILLLPLITKYISLLLSKINGLIFGESASLGARNISDSKIINSNIKLVAVSLSIVLLVFITSLSLQEIFTNARDVFDGNIQAFGMTNRAEDYDFLKEVDGVDDIQYLFVHQEPILINGDEHTISLGGFENEKLGIENVEGKIENLEDGKLWWMNSM